MWPQCPTVAVSPPDLISQMSYPGSPRAASARVRDSPSCLDCPHYRLIKATKQIRAACLCPAFGAKQGPQRPNVPRPHRPGLSFSHLHPSLWKTLGSPVPALDTD